MKHLLNTLFVLSEDAYLTLEGENVVVKRGQEKVARFPLHTLKDIISFSYAGASPALMGECCERNIGIAFCTPNGKFLARTDGISGGNVLLRRAQYRIADAEDRSVIIIRNMIFGKLYNCRWTLERTLRDHKPRVNEEQFENAIAILKELEKKVLVETSIDVIRGYEGSAATAYFGVYDQMILRNKDSFFFRNRNRRPPLDNVNAMLSFAYSLLTNECASALESVGFDCYVGFMHTDRPGRKSLALDLEEELRSAVADRFVLMTINNRVMVPADFEKSDSGAIIMTEEGRKKFLHSWHDYLQDEIKHPFLGEKIPKGLIPTVQSMLLARYIRGDLDEYPPFLWR